MFLILLLQSERLCGLFTQCVAPLSLYPGLMAGWPLPPVGQRPLVQAAQVEMCPKIRFIGGVPPKAGAGELIAT